MSDTPPKVGMPVEHEYKRLKQFNIQVRKYPGGETLYVAFEDLKKALEAHGPGLSRKFHDLFGCQTMGILGPYPHDVEAVLEVLTSGQRTGTQLWFD